MNTWQIITLVLAILFGAGWVVVIPAINSLWAKLQKLKNDYEAASADGTITDAEKAQLADDMITAIADASTIFQFFSNLIVAIIKAITTARVNSGKPGYAARSKTTEVC